MTLLEIFSILIIHWIADFIFQDEKWALGKSKNWTDLLKHTATYSSVWLLAGFCIYLKDFKPYDLAHQEEISAYWQHYIPLGLLFILITFVFHTLTDYFTSRIVSKQFEKKHYGSSIPNFGGFTTIGFDQLLHYFQLFTTYYLLTT